MNPFEDIVHTAASYGLCPPSNQNYALAARFTLLHSRFDLFRLIYFLLPFVAAHFIPMSPSFLDVFITTVIDTIIAIPALYPTPSIKLFGDI
jgi:hypothetical protein